MLLGCPSSYFLANLSNGDSLSSFGRLNRLLNTKDKINLLVHLFSRNRVGKTLDSLDYCLFQ